MASGGGASRPRGGRRLRPAGAAGAGPRAGHAGRRPRRRVHAGPGHRRPRLGRGRAGQDDPGAGVRRRGGGPGRAGALRRVRRPGDPADDGPVRDIAHELGGPLAAALAGGADLEQVFGVLPDVLAEAPTVLVIEDLHWADDATLDVIRFLARRVPTLPTVVVITYRDEDVGDGHRLRRVLGNLTGEWVRRLALAPLSLDAVATMAGTAACPPASCTPSPAATRSSSARCWRPASWACRPPWRRGPQPRRRPRPRRPAAARARGGHPLASRALAPGRAGPTPIPPPPRPRGPASSAATRATCGSATSWPAGRWRARSPRPHGCGPTSRSSTCWPSTTTSSRPASSITPSRRATPGAGRPRPGRRRGGDPPRLVLPGHRLPRAAPRPGGPAPDRTVAVACSQLSYALYMVNRFADSADHGWRGVAAAEAAGDPTVVADALLRLTRTLYWSGRHRRRRPGDRTRPAPTSKALGDDTRLATPAEVARVHSDLVDRRGVAKPDPAVVERVRVAGAGRAPGSRPPPLPRPAVPGQGPAGARRPGRGARHRPGGQLALVDPRDELPAQAVRETPPAAASNRTPRRRRALARLGLERAMGGEFTAGAYRLDLTLQGVRLSRGAGAEAEAGLRTLVDWPGDPGIMRPLAASLLARLLAGMGRHAEARVRPAVTTARSPESPSSGRSPPRWSGLAGRAGRRPTSASPPRRWISPRRHPAPRARLART